MTESSRLTLLDSLQTQLQKLLPIAAFEYGATQADILNPRCKTKKAANARMDIVRRLHLDHAHRNVTNGLIAKAMGLHISTVLWILRRCKADAERVWKL